jgi:hypothetical protein
MNDMNCNDCYFYEEYEINKGFCHRNPPDNGIARVTGNWWCGEFKDRSEPEKSKKSPN